MGKRGREEEERNVEYMRVSMELNVLVSFFAKLLGG